MNTYRVRGSKQCGKTVNELVRAPDDKDAIVCARKLAEERGITLKKLFRLGRRRRPTEIMLA